MLKQERYLKNGHNNISDIKLGKNAFPHVTLWVIMGYVYEDVNDKTHNKKISLWYWQIKEVWNHLKKLKKQ